MKNQSGRSMIEMLGVLAIIGVLSLGGVATFNAAMNRHTANNLTYDVMLMVESTVSLGPQEQMPFDASTEYNQMSSVRDANGIVNVTVQDVENDICEVLLSKAGNDVFEFRDADGNALDACADDTTDVVFAFTGDGFGGNNPVNPGENDCPGGCSTGHICVDGECCPNVIPENACSIESTEACASVTPLPKPDGTECGDNGQCQSGDCIEGEWECSGNWIGANCDRCGLSASSCGDEQNIDPEHCLCVCGNDGYTGYYCSYSCPLSTTRVSGLSKSACEACGNAVWDNGYCHGCGYSGAISFDTEAEAEACVAACADSVYERDAYGKSCSKPTCPGATGAISDMSESACEACDNTVWSGGLCYGCGRSSYISFDTEAEAEECENACAGTGYERTADGNYCYRSPSTQCPRETESTSNMTKSDCEECGNAFWNDGKCYGCGYEYSLSFDTESEADACVSACAGTGYERTADGNYCYRSPSTQCPGEWESTFNMTKSDCEECGNAFWFDGECYNCSYQMYISFPTEAEAEACASACADSGYERVVVDGNYCYLAENGCPWETDFNPVMTKSTCEGACWGAVWSDGYCYFCGYSGSISFDTEAEAEECENACAGTGYERTADGRYCYRSPSTDCPLATSSTSNMTKSDCEECGNAFWRNGTCFDCGYSSSSPFATEAEAEACVSACADSGYPREVDKSGDLYYCNRK